MVNIGPWISNTELLQANPELHHYTNRAGLKGIWESNTLWATHFAELNDRLEMKMLRDPLARAIEDRAKKEIVRQQRISRKAKSAIDRCGGVQSSARALAERFVDDHLDILFHGNAAVAQPFICSFCSHSRDQEYERENGLLSQWRGYGGDDGRFALVFDFVALDGLLAQEWKAHYWLSLDLMPAIYLDEFALLDKHFSSLIDETGNMIVSAMRGETVIRDAFVGPFLNAATAFKHRGFSEERELRILALPHSRAMMEKHGKSEDFAGIPPFKELHDFPGSKTHIALFSSLNVELPIKRIVVGPSKNQQPQVEYARSLIGGKVPIRVSETPFTD